MIIKGVPYKGYERIGIILKAGIVDTARALKNKDGKDNRGSKRMEIKRDYNIIQDLCKGNGYSDLVIKYDLSKQRIEQIVKEWHKAAELIINGRPL